MKTQRRAGFTLIELLTVIAIIGILASMIMVGMGRYIERAKLTKTQNAFRQINTLMVDYATENSGYPPAYGFKKWESKAKFVPGYVFSDADFHLTDYMSLLRAANNQGLHDLFSDGLGYDTDGDGVISYLEFAPDPKSATWYNGANEAGEVAKQLNSSEPRPFIYAPVNLSQFKRAKKFWEANDPEFANVWNPADPALAPLSFPPPKYDAYVLLSVSPRENLGGVGPLPPAGVTYATSYDAYHIAALRTYYLATRDLNGNGVFDFDYIARSQKKEANALDDAGKSFILPDGTNLYGPVIFASQ